MKPLVSVLMPTYNHDAFIARAINSLCEQQFADWELLIVNDGAADNTVEVVRPYLNDPRIHFLDLGCNQGVGAALNAGLERARGELIAYLPSDDVYYDDHLASLVAALEERPDALLAFSGVRHHYNRLAAGQIDGFWLQMVQVMHRRTPLRWLERDELVSDDLGRLFWDRLGPADAYIGTGSVTCEWVDHPHQLHRLLQEPIGGINTFRAHFNVPYPMRYHTTEGNYIDEVEHYRQFRERPDTPPAADGLKIVLAGELAYNPERVLALEEAGHTLYGLWMEQPYWYNSVGPLPFGHVRDLDRRHWREEMRDIRPDIIYAQLNWQAVPFIRDVLRAETGVPLVWHFKEGPFICLEHGIWDDLVEVHQRAAAQIFCNQETMAWYETAIPGVTRGRPSMLLDGDLPKKEWLAGRRSPRLSDRDGEIHTVVPGRPIGLHPHTVAELAAQGIHLHFYGNFTQKQWVEWVAKTEKLAPDHLHLHDHVDQGLWVQEFSQYDAGWLHWIRSMNGGDIRRANWDDLNYPARLNTLVMAGLPVLQYDNEGAAVATQSIGREHDISIFFSSIEELGQKLRERERVSTMREHVWQQRDQFTFDYHVDRLVSFFREVIAQS